MNPHELPGVEGGFDGRDGAPGAVLLSSGMHQNIVAIGLEPIDIGQRHEARASSFAHQHPEWTGVALAGKRTGAVVLREVEHRLFRLVAREARQRMIGASGGPPRGRRDQRPGGWSGRPPSAARVTAVFLLSGGRVSVADLLVVAIGGGACDERAELGVPRRVCLADQPLQLIGRPQQRHLQHLLTRTRQRIAQTRGRHGNRHEVGSLQLEGLHRIFLAR